MERPAFSCALLRITFGLSPQPSHPWRAVGLAASGLLAAMERRETDHA